MSGSKVTLPSGGWIELRHTEITERQRRTVRTIVGRLSPGVKEAFAEAGADTKPEAIAGIAGEGDLAAMFELNDAIAVAVIDSWSFEAPVSTDALLDLPGKDYDAILEATAPFVGAFMGLDTSTSTDLDSPT